MASAKAKTGSKKSTKSVSRKKKQGRTIRRVDSAVNKPVAGPRKRRPANAAVTRNSASAKRRGPIRQSVWEKYSDEQLLDTRICDLGLTIDTEWLKPKIEKLYNELADRGIRFRPHVWLSDEWFSPDGIPGIAIPFCLAHPRLKKIERKQMLEVEGGTNTLCMQILRHETGHAVDTAFRLHRKKAYKTIFGNYNNPYPNSYRPKPDSKRFVLHLEPWYAQCHPAEDFAETFAVWLKPRSPWRKQYAGWHALKKLNLVDQMMKNIVDRPPPVRTRVKADPVSRNRKTLREHYQDRHEMYSTRRPTSFDYDLSRLFPVKSKSRRGSGSRNGTAAAFLQRNRVELSRVVAQWTGEYRYNVNQVLREMIERCRELELRVSGNSAELKQRAIVMLTVQTMNYLHGGHHRVAL